MFSLAGNKNVHMFLKGKLGWPCTKPPGSCLLSEEMNEWTDTLGAGARGGRVPSLHLWKFQARGTADSQAPLDSSISHHHINAWMWSHFFDLWNLWLVFLCSTSHTLPSTMVLCVFVPQLVPKGQEWSLRHLELSAVLTQCFLHNRSPINIYWIGFSGGVVC